MKTSRLIVVALVLIAAGAAPFSSAYAGTTWLCSITQATAIDEDGTVGPPEMDGLERPTFLRVDLDRQEVTVLAPTSRAGEVTKIDAAHQQEPGVWVFSGREHGRPWSMFISSAGHMTLSVATDGAVWAVFGRALQED